MAFSGPAITIGSALAPRALSEDQPDAHLTERKTRKAVADQARSPLAIRYPGDEMPGPDFDHDVKVSDVERRPAPEPDLDVARSWRPGPGFLRALHCLGDNIGQQPGQSAENVLAHRRAVGHINQRHTASLPASAAA